MSGLPPLNAPVVPPPTRTRKASQANDSPVPRKRRRRIAGSGASDDCFTCADQQVACDRRRPYCSQCLDQGKRCSGYKTTLTWGVGVASRGKLRGLSLPITGSQKFSANASPAATSKGPKESRKSQASQEPEPERRTAPLRARDLLNREETPPDPMTPLSSYSNASWPPSASTNSSAGAYQVTHPTISNITSVPQSLYEPSSGYINTYTSAPLCSSTAESLIASSADQRYQNAWSQSAPVPQFSAHSSSVTSEQPVTFQANYAAHPVSNSLSQSEDEVDESRAIYTMPRKAYNTLVNIYNLHQPLLHQSIGRTPRIRYLIDYYMEVIAPVIVAFDAPNNPFRLYMMELAQSSETLQHAIATLSLSNLRQRRKNWGLSTGKTLPCRQSSEALYRLTRKSISEDLGLSDPEDQMKEETFHKTIVIRSVNSQLADPVARRSESLLATLLILILFHMCETGMASYKAQFGGIWKLFALHRNSGAPTSEMTKWFMRMFTLFDTITATVNNRDSQLSRQLMDIVAQPGDEWALENLSGCDSRLFQMVSRLSWLNQLSQMKLVQPNGTAESPVPTATPPPSVLHYSTHSPPVYPHENFMPFPGNIPDMSQQTSDPRPEFWQEWRSMRQKFESWRLDPSSLTHVGDLSDVSNISESFRYAGLLYLERLANPQLPSSHPQIQNLVYGALHFITAVKSDVYLLWPLFITGSECVLESDRDLIRERCGDIQKDSGFVNNLACLQLLEKIWASESIKGATPFTPDGPQGTFPGAVNSSEAVGREPFKWSRIVELEKNTHEYIVV